MAGCRLPLRHKAWTTTLIVLHMSLVCAASQQVDACPANSAHKSVISDAVGAVAAIGSTQSVNLNVVINLVKTALSTALLALFVLWRLLCFSNPIPTPNPISFSAQSIRGTLDNKVTTKWESYVSWLMKELPHGGKMTSAAVIGQDGRILAQSEEFPEITPVQVAAILKGFESYEKYGHPGDELGNAGLCLGKQGFRVAGGDDSIMRGRYSGVRPLGIFCQTRGCTIKRTETALVIGIYDTLLTGHLPVDADIAVDFLGDYLIKSHI